MEINKFPLNITLDNCSFGLGITYIKDKVRYYIELELLWLRIQFTWVHDKKYSNIF